MSFDALSAIKHVLVMHLLRQMVEADLVHVRRLPLQLGPCLCTRLSDIHARLLAAIGEQKRALRKHGVRVIQQQKNSLDFAITYIERGYQVQHCFLLATLQAEAQILFANWLHPEGEDRNEPPS